MEPIRLQKFFTDCGILSRRAAEAEIKAGKVFVNGVRAEIGQKIDPDTDKEQYYYKWYGDAKDFQKRQHRFSWLGPTRVEITLSYDLLYRRNNKKGVSFRNRETTINY